MRPYADTFFKDINKLIASTTSPISVLNELEKSNNSKAKIALQSGLNDSISILKQCPKILIDKIDLDLKTSNLPSTNELIGIVTKTIKKVLSKKFISNLDQYYTIKEVVDSDKSEIKEKGHEIFVKLFDRI
jgi:hypothetical protein